MLKINSIKTISSILLLSSVLASVDSRVLAATLSYNNGDVLLCFRKTGGGSYDLVVDAGPVSTFTNLPAGQKIVLNPGKYTSAQLGLVGGTNNLSWSAFAYYNSGAAANTIYMSDPWSDANTPADPYTCSPSSAQLAVISFLGSVAFAATNSVYVDTADSSTTAALVVESTATSPYDSYFNALGLPNYDNFHNTFQADPEQSTPGNFTSGGTPVRADFYQMTPYAGFPGPNGNYWGYFEFATNGVMTYISGPAASVTAPTIVSISRSGTTSTITFTTGPSGTYTLLGTNNLTAPIATWPAINSVPGDGSNHSLQDVTSGAYKFYIISAQ